MIRTASAIALAVLTLSLLPAQQSGEQRARFRQVNQFELQTLAEQGSELVGVTPYVYLNEERGGDAVHTKPVVTQSPFLFPDFDHEMASTRRILERVPDDKFNYNPHEKSMTPGRLAGHVDEMPAWGKLTIEVDVLELQSNAKG